MFSQNAIVEHPERHSRVSLEPRNNYRLHAATSDLKASSGKRISVASELLRSLDVVFGGLTSLLLSGQSIDLLTCLDEAAVVLLLDLGSNIVEGYKGGGSVDVIFILDSGTLVNSLQMREGLSYVGVASSGRARD